MINEVGKLSKRKIPISFTPLWCEFNTMVVLLLIFPFLVKVSKHTHIYTSLVSSILSKRNYTPFNFSKS